MDEIRIREDEEARERTPPVIGPEQLLKWTRLLQKYKAGKASLERRVRQAENWWKIHNEIEEARTTKQNPEDFHCKSGWLHNVIVSKHADAMEAYPEPNILPREAGDRAEAEALSSVIPALLEQAKFERTYDRAMWQKLKTGTAAYRVIWDQSKLNGLGDILIETVSLLSLFWEPGVNDIQESRYVFATHLEDKDELQSLFPQLRDGKMKSSSFQEAKFLYDDTVDTSDKTTVIEVYYHRYEGERRVLHYCKYVGDVVLYSTENEGKGGLYEHGRYPFVLDPLYPVEGSPCGYGFVDLAANVQTQIDLLKTAFLKNTMVGATPRYFQRQDGSVNEEEFLDLRKPLVKVSGNLGEDSLRLIQHPELSGNYIAVLENTIHELRQVTGNTETATGTTTAGATAASAIAALQEASGKGSRDCARGSYQAFADICELIIELIRQFYTMPRLFRITGQDGEERFTSYSNAGIKPVYQGVVGRTDLGYRAPQFDLKIKPQKRTAYTRISQNEMALEFYGAGFFDPQRAEQAMNTLGMMEFEGKEEIMRKISQNARMYDQLLTFQRLALALTAKYEPQRMPELTQAITGQPAGAGTPSGPGVPEADFEPDDEPTHVQKARQRAAAASQPRE